MRTLRRFKRRFYRWLYAKPERHDASPLAWMLIALVIVAILALTMHPGCASLVHKESDPFPGIDAVPGF